jgi:hypothetical protein
VKRVLLFGLCFFGIFLLHRYLFTGTQPTPILYDKPVQLKMLKIPTTAVPSGYTADEATGGTVVKPADIGKRSAELLRAGFPKTDRVTEYLMATYTGTLGDKVPVITARYGAKDDLAGLDSKFKSPRYFTQDYYLAWIGAETDPVVDRFYKAYEDNAKVQKERRAKLEMVAVAGQAELKLLANVLVGSFVFLVVLFLVKYFLVIRQVEE